MNKTVAILGGGIGGLSAAHELAERGFRVRVYERNAILGGRARSIGVPGSGAGTRKDLPGEHGFRSFPSFYKHVPDTMSHIPFPGNAHGVLDNLVPTTRTLVASDGESPVHVVPRFPETVDDFFADLEAVMRIGFSVPPDETMFYISRLTMLLSACEERRVAEYEKMPWWEFTAAARMSPQYQRFLGRGFTRSLVAIRAEEGSTRTVGYIGLQLGLGILQPGTHVDRVLNGPTSEVWIDPWVTYLCGLGVEFHTGVTVRAIHTDGARVTGVTVERQGRREELVADYYIAAVPVEAMVRLLSDDLRSAAPSLAQIDRLRTSWMNGMQYFLRDDVPLAHGHVIFADSPWALTGVSQPQFWAGIDLAEYGDGTVRGILSVDISEWDTPGILYDKAARHCTAEEIRDEVWAQMLTHLPGDIGRELAGAGVVASFLDPAIGFDDPATATNAEPLLINTVDSLAYRPEAYTELPNLFIAADYVRTYSGLACMGTANEAARRAVNALLAEAGSPAPRAGVWPLEEPDAFASLRELDRQLFAQGLPHAGAAGARLAGALTDLFPSVNLPDILGFMRG